jgi:hypothetical protein
MQTQVSREMNNDVMNDDNVVGGGVVSLVVMMLVMWSKRMPWLLRFDG